MTAVRPNVDTLSAVYENLTRIGDYLDEHVVLYPATRAVDPDTGEVRGRRRCGTGRSTSSTRPTEPW